MNNSKGLLIVLSGPSGAGKDTVLKELLAHNDKVRVSISATTRQPDRERKTEGITTSSPESSLRL